MKKYGISLFATIFVFLSSCGTKNTVVEQEEKNINNYGNQITETKKPQKFNKDLVPDEQTAVKIAEAIWASNYDYVKDKKRLPYIIFLEENKIWYIKTSLPKGSFGQVLNIKINKYDGRILYLWSEM